MTRWNVGVRREDVGGCRRASFLLPGSFLASRDTLGDFDGVDVHGWNKLYFLAHS